MARYSTAQYAAQERIMRIIRAANVNGVCPICGQPQGVWPDGVRRITCNSNVCHGRWLSIRPTYRQASPADHAPRAGSTNGFTVTLVIGGNVFPGKQEGASP